MVDLGQGTEQPNASVAADFVVAALALVQGTDEARFPLMWLSHEQQRFHDQGMKLLPQIRAAKREELNWDAIWAQCSS